MSIVLIGFMAAGKSSVGKEVARRMNLSWMDTDTLVEEMVGRSIPDIFAHDGEAYFREKEHEALVKALNQAEVVMTGGGIVELEKNQSLLQEHAPVIFLKAHPSVWKERLHHDGTRPNATSRSRVELVQLYVKRLPLYERSATVTVDTTNLSMEETVELVMSCVGTRAYSLLKESSVLFDS